AHGHEAATTYLEAATLAPRLEGLELRSRAVDQLLRCAYLPEGLALFEEVRRELGIQGAKLTPAGMLGFLWRRLRVRLRGFDFTPRPAAEIAPFELLRMDFMLTSSSSLAQVLIFEAADFSTRFVLRALELGEPVRVAQAACCDAFQASASDSPGS